MTPPNGEAVKQGKQPKPSEEQETIVKEITLRDQIQNKILDAPLNPIPLNGQVAEQEKNPNPSEEKEPIGKEITLRDKIQNKILDATLYKIVPNGQVAEQGNEQRKEKITPPIISIPKVSSKDNPNKFPPK